MTLWFPWRCSVCHRFVLVRRVLELSNGQHAYQLLCNHHVSWKMTGTRVYRLSNDFIVKGSDKSDA